VVIVACLPQNQDEMTKLEKEVAEAPTNTNVSLLLDLYNGWLQEHPEKSPDQKSILKKSVDVSLQHQRYGHALAALKGLAIDYADDEDTPSHLLQMRDILDKMGKTVAVRTLSKAFSEKYPGEEQSLSLAESASISVPLDTFIQNIGEQIFGEGAVSVNEDAARQYVDACEAYALVYQGSDNAAELLYKASETARTMRSTGKALELYEWLIRGYPDHKRSGQALFLRGFTYDNDLHDLEKARESYQTFLDKYPNDDFASSAQFLLENLGKSDDELLEVLQQRNAGQQKEPQ
jgi:TolA-binding protein